MESSSTLEGPGLTESVSSRDGPGLKVSGSGASADIVGPDLAYGTGILQDIQVRFVFLENPLGVVTLAQERHTTMAASRCKRVL